MGRETDNSKQDSLKSKSFMQNLIKQSASTRGRGSCSENQDGAVLQERLILVVESPTSTLEGVAGLLAASSAEFSDCLASSAVLVSSAGFSAQRTTVMRD